MCSIFSPIFSLFPHEKKSSFILLICFPVSLPRLPLLTFLFVVEVLPCFSLFSFSFLRFFTFSIAHRNLQVEWLHENRPEGCTVHAMNMAAGAGHLNVVSTALGTPCLNNPTGMLIWRSHLKKRYLGSSSRDFIECRTFCAERKAFVLFGVRLHNFALFVLQSKPRGNGDSLFRPSGKEKWRFRFQLKLKLNLTCSQWKPLHGTAKISLRCLLSTLNAAAIYQCRICPLGISLSQQSVDVNLLRTHGT